VVEDSFDRGSGTERAMTWARKLAGAQAAYFLVTGVWPLVHRRSFELVTGPKEDFWLVRTVGGLAAATGVALGIAVVRGERTRETSALALATGVVFVAADVRAAKTESRSYVGDVVLQVAFTPAWFAAWD
jgi:hypothetical protein